jgi:serine/threonine-protein kinase
MAAAADRQLLFGLLALQNEFIDQTQLVAAFRAWSRDKSRSLADYLEARGDVTKAMRVVLDKLAELHVEARDGDFEKSLAAVSVLASEFTWQCLTLVGDEDLEQTLGHVASLCAATIDARDDRVETRVFGMATSDGERFRVLRPHAKGGLGAVYVALDAELNREVALKQILDQHADDPISRHRFLVEAEITGGLEHPGIVPIYGMGKYGDGRPYYAMRFIRGDTLKEAIDQFQSARKSTVPPAAGRESTPTRAGATGSRDLAFRKLLGRFTAVCNTIDYAHSRGVIHRDIKPSNIIVGQHGETLVVDWGLAKSIGRNDLGTHSGEPVLAPSSPSGSCATLPGGALGTPAYMSPEQAAGQLDRQGVWSDVYSLGATLYYLLTGKPAFEGDSVPNLLSAVKEGDFPPPRKLDQKIDRALEAICLKSMSLAPDDRYPSARALADDIDRWLADEPVKAHREGGLERLARWLRHHRVWTYAAAAALVGTSLAATIGVVVVDAARRREAAVRQEAETNFSAAQRAVDDYLTSVSENTLLKRQDSVDMRSLRKELLTNALSYYTNFVKERQGDPRLRQQLATAHYRVAQITREIGSLVQALEEFQAAQKVWESLAASEPGNHQVRENLADCHERIGQIRYSMGDHLTAMTSLTEAIAILERLTIEHPEITSYQASLAHCYMSKGIYLSELMQLNDAEQLLLKAKAIKERLIAQRQGSTNDQYTISQIMNALGNVHFQRRDFPASLRSFQESQRICQALLDAAPGGSKPVHLLDSMALSHYNMATVHEQTNRLEDSLESFRHSLDYRMALADAHPSVTDYQEQLGKNLAELAVIEHRAHHDEEAFASIKRSLDVLEKLVASHPDRPGFLHDLGRSLNIQGYFLDEVEDHAQAIPIFDRAIKVQSRAVVLSPKVDEFKFELSSQLDNRGEQEVDLGRVSDALPFYEREVALVRELLAARPGNPTYTQRLSEVSLKIGNIKLLIMDSAFPDRPFAEH